MTWMISEDQLDSDQRHFINNESRSQDNIWISGFAGSGKSVLLVHSLKERLQREPNAKIVIVVYTHSLIALFNAGLEELNISNVEVMTHFTLKKKCEKNPNLFYDYIYCDEVQDLSSNVIEFIRNKAKKVIVAGDKNQSIYDTDFSETMLLNTLNAQSFTLNIIHRLTQSIIKVVDRLLPNMKIFSSKRDLTKQDVNVRLGKATSLEEECRYVYEEAKKSASFGYSTVILFSTNDELVYFANMALYLEGKDSWSETKNQYGKPDYQNLNIYLNNKKVPMQVVQNGYGSLTEASDRNQIILMTYHSSKGLDFDSVFVPLLDTNLYLPEGKKEVLFMVALTRSKQNLYLTYTKEMHPLLDIIKTECSEIQLSNKKPEISKSADFDF